MVIRSTRGYVDLFGEIKSKKCVTPTTGSPFESNAEAAIAYCDRTILNSSSDIRSKSAGSNKTKSLTDLGLSALNINAIRPPKL